MGFFSSVTSSVTSSLAEEVQKQQQRPQEVIEAQQQAIDLGIYEIVRNVAGKGKNIRKSCEAVWEGCRVVFEQVGTIVTSDGETSITMPDGTILYRALEKGQKVIDFRYGAWVERIKKYSDEITAEKQREAEAEAQQRREEKLKPFSKIDF